MKRVSTVAVSVFVFAVLLVLSMYQFASYPVPLAYAADHARTQWQSLFRKDSDPIDASFLYMKAVVNGDVDSIRLFVVEDGAEDAVSQARDNRDFYESYGVKIRFVRFEPRVLNVISPTEASFLVDVALYITSSHWTELESFVWAVSMVKGTGGWKVAKAEVFEHSSQLLKEKI